MEVLLHRYDMYSFSAFLKNNQTVQKKKMHKIINLNQIYKKQQYYNYYQIHYNTTIEKKINALTFEGIISFSHAAHLGENFLRRKS